MKPRARIALAAIAASGVVTAMACFPDVTFMSETGGGAAGAASTSSSSGATTGSSGHTTTTSSSTTSSSTTSSSTTSSSSADAGVTCVGADPCDCDGDGDRADTAACDHDGGDCNDHDPEVNSKQTKWFTVSGSNGWDYNCDGSNEYEYVPVLSCGLLCGGSGWTSKMPFPDCGVTSQYGICKGLPCAEVLQGSMPQGCH